MDTTELLEILNGIFRKVLKRDDITFTEIENKFGVRFSFREIVKLKNVGDLCHTIKNKAK